MAWLPDREKISKICLFVLTQLTNVTDRQTDGQTDRHRTPTYTALMHMHRAIKTTEQRTTIQQYGDWYTGRWWMGCYIRYSEEGPGRAVAPPSALFAVPDVTVHPLTASVPTAWYSMAL